MTITDELLLISIAIFYVGFILLLLKLKVSVKNISIINFYLFMISVFYMLVFEFNKVFIGLSIYTFASSLIYFINLAFNKGYSKH